MTIMGIVVTAIFIYIYLCEEEPELRAADTARPASSELRGVHGEALVSATLRQCLTRLCGENYKILDSVILNHAPGEAFPTAEVDHLAVTPFGVFVIETKHWAGSVRLGEERDALILETHDGRSLTRTSPLKQNAAKIRFIRSLLPAGLRMVEGLGVFSHEAVRLEPALPSALLELGELYRHLRVRQQQFARARSARLPVYEVADAILKHADLRPEALTEHRDRIRAQRDLGKEERG
ncbi:nuclease-related domain-containing protein [Paraburkholderia sp. 2C]